MRKRRSSLFARVLLWAAMGCSGLSAALLLWPHWWTALLAGTTVAVAAALHASHSVKDYADYLQRGIDALPAPVPPIPASEEMEELE